MMKSHRSRAHRTLGVILLSGIACEDYEPTERVEPTFIEVTTSGELASADSPMEFNPETSELEFTVQTLDVHGQPASFEGDLTVRVRPGRLVMDPKITVSGGSWTGTVSYQASFGPTRIWFGDEGDKDVDSGRAASWATGVSPIIHYKIPTIAQMQRIDDPETNQLAGENAELQIAEREVVVTQVATDGFWATDLGDGPSDYGSIYVYTFNKPDGVVAGSRLNVLNGGVQEYLGTTQLSFPHYGVFEGETLTVPDPVEFAAAGLCDGTAVDSTVAEAYEASAVEATNLRIPSSFTSNSEEYFDYLEYGQWPVETEGGCILYVESGAALPGIDPTDYAGADVPLARGMPTQVWSKWIITVTDADDIQIDGLDTIPETVGRSRVRRPLPRPRWSR